MTNKELYKLASLLGNKKEYFQGAGGNVSVKLPDGIMLIKASGLKVSDMTGPEAIVAVTYPDIQSYFYKNDAGSDGSGKDMESAALIKGLTQGNGLRPSMETGFHALLGNAVLHTHSTYVNLLTCAEQFEKLIRELFPTTVGDNVTYSAIGYAAPGHFLTHKVKSAILDAKKTASTPHVIFMKNHGIIVSAASIDESIKLHESINNKIIEHFGIRELFPDSKINVVSKDKSESASPFLKSFARDNPSMFSNIKDYMLFPDLVVFCKDITVSADSAAEGKIIINPETGSIIYNTNAREAEFIEENLLAWAYLMKSLTALKLSAQFISDENSKDIENMESENYRKKMVF